MQASLLATLLTLCCTVRGNSGYTLTTATEGKRIFFNGDTCMYYCKSPCAETPAHDSPFPDVKLYHCNKYSPEGAGMNGWLQMALVVIGMLSSYCGCNAVYWIYLWQKGRPSVKPSGENAWNGSVEKDTKEAPKDVAVEEGQTTKAVGSNVAKTDNNAGKDKPKDAEEKLKDVIHV